MIVGVWWGHIDKPKVVSRGTSKLLQPRLSCIENMLFSIWIWLLSISREKTSVGWHIHYSVITRQVNIINFIALRLNYNLLNSKLILLNSRTKCSLHFFFYFSRFQQKNWSGDTKLPSDFVEFFLNVCSSSKINIIASKKGWKCERVSILGIEFK